LSDDFVLAPSELLEYRRFVERIRKSILIANNEAKEARLLVDEAANSWIE